MNWLDRISPVNLVAPVALALAMAGCSGAKAPATDVSFAESGETFGAEDRRIAARLSLGEDDGAANELSPYLRAVRCKVGIAAMGERLTTMGLATAEQKRAMAQAIAAFDARLKGAARDAGKNESTVADDVRKGADSLAEQGPETSVRIAIGCMRKMEQDMRS